MEIVSKLENYLHQQGNEHLTIILLGLAVFGIVVALFAPPELKLLVIVYWLLP